MFFNCFGFLVSRQFTYSGKRRRIQRSGEFVVISVHQTESVWPKGLKKAVDRTWIDIYRAEYMNVNQLKRNYNRHTWKAWIIFFEHVFSNVCRLNILKPMWLFLQTGLPVLYVKNCQKKDAQWLTTSGTYKESHNF